MEEIKTLKQQLKVNQDLHEKIALNWLAWYTNEEKDVVDVLIRLYNASDWNPSLKQYFANCLDKEDDVFTVSGFSGVSYYRNQKE